MTPSDYLALLDDEMRVFVEKTASFYPQDGGPMDLAVLRRSYDTMCEAFRQDRPAGLSVTDVSIPSTEHSIPVRRYEPVGEASATLLYAHGGGFVLGGLDSHDDACAGLCHNTGFRVIAVDYRLSPEYPFPADIEDMETAFEAIAAQYEGPLLLAGDSAGGTLMAALAHAKRNHPRRIDGVLLIYPALGGDVTKGSYVDHANAPGLTTEDMFAYGNWRAGGDYRNLKGNPRAAPLAESHFSDLPPTVIITADLDPLRDDGRDYRDALLEAGVEVVWRNEPGLVHGYLRARHVSRKAQESFQFMGQSLVRLAEKQPT